MTVAIRIGCTTIEIPKMKYTVHSTAILTRVKRMLVRKSFQPKEFQYSTAAIGNFNTAAKTKTLQQVYKSLGWILMHVNSVPS